VEPPSLPSLPWTLCTSGHHRPRRLTGRPPRGWGLWTRAAGASATTTVTKTGGHTSIEVLEAFSAVSWRDGESNATGGRVLNMGPQFFGPLLHVFRRRKESEVNLEGEMWV
jgi:hypothetical protein